VTPSHPLFPADSPDTDPPEVLAIHVMRSPDGTHHRPFDPTELTSLEQIYSMFGGGTYTLVARNNRWVTARRTVTLPGKPLPLNPPVPTAEDDEPESPRAIYQPAPPSSDHTLLLALLQMMQAQAKSQTDLMIAMMTANASSGREHIATMQALHDRHATQQTELMRAILSRESESPRQSGAGGELDLFMRGVEFGQQITDDGGDDVADVVESLGPLLAGMGAAKDGGDT